MNARTQLLLDSRVHPNSPAYIELVQRLLGRVPLGQYQVDANVLKEARDGTPKGEYHIDADALRDIKALVPTGEYHVDAEALKNAKGNTPPGEYHS